VRQARPSVRVPDDPLRLAEKKSRAGRLADGDVRDLHSIPPAVAHHRRAWEDAVTLGADRELWTAELAMHEAELRTASRYICRDDNEREDLIQDTFERALRHLGAGNPKPTNMRAWLVSILRNAFIDRKRRAAVAGTVFDDDQANAAAAPDPDPEPPWSTVSL